MRTHPRLAPASGMGQTTNTALYYDKGIVAPLRHMGSRKGYGAR
jgi:hypothetical protein